MNPPLSWWEYQDAFDAPDLTVVGAGLVGLSAAYFFAEKQPNAKILVLEGGNRPSGATLRNAGFACFGSPGELLDDLSQMPAQEVMDLLKARRRGLSTLRNLHGDRALDFENCGGYELFFDSESQQADAVAEKLPELNRMLREAGIFQRELFKPCGPMVMRSLGFSNLYKAFFHAEEGALNPVKLWRSLLSKCLLAGIRYIPGSPLQELPMRIGPSKWLARAANTEFFTSRVLMATNAFAHPFFENELQPARAQVLVTKPIPGKKPKGIFHHNQGYNYFRFVQNRLLIGGGRDLDKAAETTDKLVTSKTIQMHLEHVAKHHLGLDKLEVEFRWAGLMGMGPAKVPLLRSDAQGRFWAVRLGGMGIALGTDLGESAATLLHQS